MGPASTIPAGVSTFAGRTAPRLDQVNVTLPVHYEWPTRIPKTVSPSRVTLGLWADAKDDEDFGVEDGELQDSEAVSVTQTESISGLPMLAAEDISELSSRGLPSQMISPGVVIVSSPERVEVVYDDILAVDKALQETDGAFIEVGKSNRGRLAGRGNLHGVDAAQSPCVNLEDITAAVVGNHNQTVKPVTFSPRVTRSRRGAG
ncbi:hypothetical protein NE237_010421 [Protea cynaroides]|uniref:Uncharacterized protein n=1 Tax=Protea cynaroides TaxID=273540 RepID=A0A9Q0L0J3_9MAGN|nr:hypothetical protein NE237_010421 [Protea cynaroides]